LNVQSQLDGAPTKRLTPAEAPSLPDLEEVVTVLALTGEGALVGDCLVEEGEEWSLVLDALLAALPAERPEILPGWPAEPAWRKSWHRFVLVHHKQAVRAYVDGVPVAKATATADMSRPPLRLLRGVHGLASHLQVRAVPAAPPARGRLTCRQMRRYAVSADEVRLLGGPSGRPIPAPSEQDLAARLCEQVGLPRAWCARALALAPGGSFRLAKAELFARQAGLLRRGRALAQALTGLGFDAVSCAVAVAATTDPTQAVRLLLNWSPEQARAFTADPSAARALVGGRCEAPAAGGGRRWLTADDGG
jgi:hypothetical protein